MYASFTLFYRNKRITAAYNLPLLTISGDKFMDTINLLELMPFVRFVNIIKGTSSDYFVPWRIIYDFEFILVTDGDLLVQEEDKSYTLHAADLHLMRPFQRHKRMIPNGCSCTYYDMHFDFFFDASSDENFSAEDIYCKPCELKNEEANVLESLAQRTLYEPSEIEIPEIIHVKNMSKLVEVFESLRVLYSSETRFKEFRMRGKFHEFLALVFDELADNSSSSPNYIVISKFIEYIFEHYDQKIDISQLASEYGFTPNYFRKIFKNITQKTPREYLLDYRVEQAKKLLSLQKYTVSEVAYMVGYDDIFQFSKVFKKNVGMSPKSYQAEFNTNASL